MAEEQRINEVTILFEGYSYVDTKNAEILRANCTSTLIRGRDGTNIIVDTMTAWDGRRIVAALAAHGLQPDDITHIVCTHGHSDHVGCNYLFQQAKYHIVGACVSMSDKYFGHLQGEQKQMQLDKHGEIIVQCTPGHTLSCVSVIVRNTQYGKDINGTVGICGDLFEREADVQDADIWQTAGSENEAAQKHNRLRLAERCGRIVPGHGAMFSITEEMRAELKRQQQEILINNN